MTTNYDVIGSAYNTTRKADPYLTARLIDLLNPLDNQLFLDIGCGTGNYTNALSKSGIQIKGVEPSDMMRAIAMKHHPVIEWLKGSSEEIPVADQTYEGVIATLTIHHWKNLPGSFLELERVLTHNGRIVLFTSTPEQMRGYWLNHYFPKMLKASIEQMPSIDDIQKSLENTTFVITKLEPYEIRDDLQDCFLYIGKNKPHVYFEEAIRNGISSFTSLSNQEEVESGLAMLRNDMACGHFDSIKNQYQHSLGDYLFIVIEKFN